MLKWQHKRSLLSNLVKTKVFKTPQKEIGVEPMGYILDHQAHVSNKRRRYLRKLQRKPDFLKAMIVMGGATEPGELFQQRELEAGPCCEENCSQSPPRHPGNGTVLHSDPEFSQTHI